MCGEDEGAVVVSEHGSGGWRDGVKDRWWCRQGVSLWLNMGSFLEYIIWL